MPRTFELVTEHEWRSINSKLIEHSDVREAMKYLAREEKEILPPTIKLPCTSELSHKKRMAATEQARYWGLKIKTKWFDGWLYIRREK